MLRQVLLCGRVFLSGDLHLASKMTSMIWTDVTKKIFGVGICILWIENGIVTRGTVRAYPRNKST